MRVEVYGCKGNAAFSPTKLAYNFGSSLLYASKIGTCSHKKKKQKQKQNKTEEKQNKKQKKTLVGRRWVPTSSRYMKIFYPLLK